MMTPGRSTFVYKRAGDCQIELDVYRPARTGQVPVVVWIHGGALIMGSRSSVPDQMLALCRDRGVAIDCAAMHQTGIFVGLTTGVSHDPQ